MEQIISEKLDNSIMAYIKRNPCKVEWSYQETLDRKQVCDVLEKGMQSFEEELYEANVDYLCHLEESLVEGIAEYFKDELIEEGFEEEQLADIIRNTYSEHIYGDINISQLLKRTGDVCCFIYVYSNYDCTNSFDTMENSNYLSQVYSRVRAGVRKNDFMYEHRNGAYGGSLFCFAFQCGLEELLMLKEQIKTGKKIVIPKGTQFGYFSSFQGAGSLFEKTTYRKMYLNIEEDGDNFNPEYDNVGITADAEQHYSLVDVYGEDDFINEQTIKIINA